MLTLSLVSFMKCPLDSSLRIIICLLKIPVTNATRVSSHISMALYLRFLSDDMRMTHQMTVCTIRCVCYGHKAPHCFSRVSLAESAGALLQAAEFCSPVRCVQSVVSRRDLWFMLQNLQQGKQAFMSVFISAERIWWSQHKFSHTFP